MNPFDRNFNDPSRENATFSLAPGERGLITLRAYCAEGVPGCSRDLMTSLQSRTALGVVAQGANCTSCTGPACTTGDLIGGFTECSLETGPPKDIYDPIPPVVTVLNPAIVAPETVIAATDNDNNGSEPVGFTLRAVDNVAVGQVTCMANSTAVTLLGAFGDLYQFTGVFPVGQTGVSCTASDVRSKPAANTATVNFIVDVRDVTPPSFDVSANPGSPFLPSNPAEATSAAGAQVFYSMPTASDNSGGPVTVTCGSGSGLVSGSIFPIGTTDIYCVATDAAGLSTAPTNRFDITVADNTPPIVSATASPSSVLWSAHSYLAPVTIAGTVTEINPASVVYRVLDEYGLVQPSGTVTVGAGGAYSFVVNLEAHIHVGDADGRRYSVTATATDRYGNQASVTIIVNVLHNP